VAYEKLERSIKRAQSDTGELGTSGLIENKRWADVTTLAAKVLSAVPNDPVALACLAEVEQAHGHADFAVTYLRYAQVSMSRGSH